MSSNVANRQREQRVSRAAVLWFERAAWIVGIVALACWASASVYSSLGSRREMRRFAELRSNAEFRTSLPDQSLWSPERVSAWRDALKLAGPPPLGVLRIPRLRIDVPVLDGTDELTLNRAVGHIEDTAIPGGAGNSGIAGHRDGFFRGLKDIRSGDVVELETIASIDRYRVERTWIVNPEDVSVLDDTKSPALTLVTCYPFYFVGSAPQRFIVRAVRTTSAPRPKAPA